MTKPKRLITLNGDWGDVLADGSIIIDTKIDTSGVKKGRSHLIKLLNQIAQNSDKVDSLKKQMKDLGESKIPTGEYSKLSAEIEKAANKMASLDAKARKYAELGVSENSQKWKSLQYDMGEAAALYDQLLDKKRRMEADGSAYISGAQTEEYERLEAALRDAEMRAEELRARLDELESSNNNGKVSMASKLKGFLSGAAGAAGKLLSVLGKGIVASGKLAVSLGSGVVNAAGKLARLLGSCASGMAKMATGGRGLAGAIKGASSSLKTLIPALLMARGILGILRKTVSAYMAQNEQLSATLSSAWTGLGNLLGPIIERIVNILATAVAYFTKFLSLLGFIGSSAKKAINTAGAAAKKQTDALKKQLMAFDELNILKRDDDDSGGGGGAGNTDAVTPNVTLPDWAVMMANQIRQGDWGSAARTLTGQLNNMVTNTDWGGIGKKAGKWFNNALTFLATAITTFDWFGLGSNLGSAINSVIDSVDWGDLGIVLGARFLILINLLGGLFATIKWDELGKAFSDGFMGLWNAVDWERAAKAVSDGTKGVLSGITSAIQNTDWQKLGSDTATFISAIDWSGITSALFSGLGAACGGIAEFLMGLLGDAWNSVINWWHDNAYEDGQFTIQGLLDGILTAMANIGTWIYDNIFQPFIDGFKSVFGINSPSTVMAEQGGFIMSGLYQGITDGWKTIQQWLTDLPGKFKDAFNRVTSWVSTTFAGAWEAAWGGLQTGVVNAVNGVIGVINNMLQTVADGVNKLFSMLNFSIDMPGIFGGGTVGFEMPTVSAPQIPYLATGAVIPPNAPFYAVLGDQRHGNNIEAPEDLIRKIVREEAGSFGNDRVEDLLETLISVVRSIHIGDDDVGQAAQRYIRSSERTMGGY